MIAFIAGAIGALGVWKVLAINESSRQLYEKIVIPIGALTNLAMETQWAWVNIRGMLLDNDPDRAAANAESLRKHFEEAEKHLETFGNNIEDGAARKQFDTNQYQNERVSTAMGRDCETPACRMNVNQIFFVSLLAYAGACQVYPASVHTLNNFAKSA